MTDDRRTLIADAALDVVAADGIRALTHRAVDRRLGLPLGSTSYYFRTRRDLMLAAAAHLRTTSRHEFERSRAATTGPGSDPGAIARAIAESVDTLLATRGRDVRARYALTVELMQDKEIRTELAASMFSTPLSVELVRGLGSTNPDRDGANFVALLEGLVFHRSVGIGVGTGPTPGTRASVDALAAAVLAYLRGLS